MVASAHPGPAQRCEVFITSELDWLKIAAGKYAADDCALVDAGGDTSVTARNASAVCQRQPNGQADRRRDCRAFVKVVYTIYTRLECLPEPAQRPG